MDQQESSEILSSQESVMKKKPRSLSAKREKKEEGRFPDVEEGVDDKIVVIGICCMEKKSRSTEMQEILNRIDTTYFRIDIFNEQMILNDPIETWPIVDSLISFYSYGFPLNKAIQYVDLRKPFVINDLRKQQVLWDRKRVYHLLKENNIPVPRHYFALKNPLKDIVEEYNKKEQVQKKSKKQQRSQQIIYEEGNNLDEVIKFLADDTTSKQSMQDQQMDGISGLSPTEELFVKPPKLQSTLRSYDEKSLTTVLQLPSKSSSNMETIVQEFDDYLIIDGQKLVKPFVEKPFDAEDHNIYIYYNSNEGGGCKKLFRKVGNQSSSFDPNQNAIRSDGENYIYEEFLQTNGFDIKVYTVGEFFAHAEARKSPVLDGKVMRQQNGKEVRYPVCLTIEEKFMATKIVNVFGQNICGFDLLRCNGKSYVCDVNGWSFVKGNQKYYQDCATVLQNMVLKKFRPQLLKRITSSTQIPRTFFKNSFRPSSNDLDFGEKNNQELRSVVAVFRHGDRTPKQKMKMKTSNRYFLQFFDDQKDPSKEIKLKHPKQLIKLLDITRQCISSDCCQIENIIKLLQMKSVLEQGGHFEGINRKVQLRPLRINEETKLPDQVLVVLKWGGELTTLGESHAVRLGQHFRHEMYPTDKDGLLRLHSTYRHDLKTYSSDEGRCQNTAAAFLKGFLGYEGEVTPILASMVIKNQNAQLLLDCNESVNQDELECKNILQEMLTSNENIIEQIAKKVPGVHLTDKQLEVLNAFGKPREMLETLLDMIKKLTRKIRHSLHLDKNYYLKPEDMNESLTLFYKRWYKLEYDFKVKDTFNISKIPDIYDSIKYDILHNFDKMQFYENPQEFYNLAQLLCQFMVPFEYGITTQHKLTIAKHVVSPLCDKIKQDLLWWRLPEYKFDEDYWRYRHGEESELNSPWRHVRTRLYFTSASHLYSLFNILYYGLGHCLIEDEQKQRALEQIIMLQYLSNIVIKLYEDLQAKPDDPNRFRLELSVSDGTQTTFPPSNDPLPVSSNIHINQSLKLEQLEAFLNQIITLEQGPIQQGVK